MKNSTYQQKIVQFNARRAVERETALKKGDMWTRPTTCMNLKIMYNRNQQKKETRKMLLEYSELFA